MWFWHSYRISRGSLTAAQSTDAKGSSCASVNKQVQPSPTEYMNSQFGISTPDTKALKPPVQAKWNKVSDRGISPKIPQDPLRVRTSCWLLLVRSSKLSLKPASGAGTRHGTDTRCEPYGNFLRLETHTLTPALQKPAQQTRRLFKACTVSHLHVGPEKKE